MQQLTANCETSPLIDMSRLPHEQAKFERTCPPCPRACGTQSGSAITSWLLWRTDFFSPTSYPVNQRRESEVEFWSRCLPSRAQWTRVRLERETPVPGSIAAPASG